MAFEDVVSLFDGDLLVSLLLSQAFLSLVCSL